MTTSNLIRKKQQQKYKRKLISFLRVCEWEFSGNSLKLPLIYLVLKTFPLRVFFFSNMPSLKKKKDKRKNSTQFGKSLFFSIFLSVSSPVALKEVL